MRVRDFKKSMLFSAVEYASVNSDMQRFYDINNATKVHPEDDILTFYLANHLLALIEDKIGLAPLSDDEANFCEQLVESMSEVFKRMFTYLLLISIGESRHGATAVMGTSIAKKFGAEIEQMVTEMAGGNRSEARGVFLSCDRNLKVCSQYCSWAFLNCFPGGLFGGPKWRDISDKIVMVLQGQISPFTMTDAAWALVHNTGPIFNKDTIYTNVHSTIGLTELLDLQRGGAIPAFISNRDKYVSKGMSAGAIHPSIIHKGMINDMKSIFGFNSGVDAFVPFAEVGKAGALSHLFSNAPPEKTGGGKTEQKATFTTTGQVFLIGPDGYPILERQK